MVPGKGGFGLWAGGGWPWGGGIFTVIENYLQIGGDAPWAALVVPRGLDPGLEFLAGALPFRRVEGDTDGGPVPLRMAEGDLDGPLPVSGTGFKPAGAGFCKPATPFARSEGGPVGRRWARRDSAGLDGF